MNSSENSVLCNSCNAYLEYLKSKNKGFERYKIEEHSILNNALRIKLQSPLKSLSELQLEINNNIVFSFSPHDVIEYNNDERILICPRSASIEKHLNSLTSYDTAYIRIDLAFLIKNLLKRFSSPFFAPQEPKISSSLSSPDKSLFIATPSDEQRAAIDCIFSKPLSYIWGAPGTGKTKYVLSNSISHYIKNNSKVLLVAPTNKALEQMLYGVIDVLKQERVFDERKIIRLGTPTTEFARDFPQICETKPLHDKIESLQKQIELLSLARYHRQVCDDLILLDELSDKIKKIKDIDFHFLDLKHRLKNNQSATSNVQNTLYRIENELYPLLKKSESQSLIHKIVRFFYGEREKRKIDFLSGQAEKYRKQIAQLTTAISSIQVALDDLFSQKEKLLHSAYEFLSDKQKLSSISTLVKKEMYHEAIVKIDSLNQRFTSPTLEFFEKYPEYSNLSLEVIKERIIAIESEKNELNTLQTPQRIEAANVVACTIDILIRRIFPSHESSLLSESSSSSLLLFSPSHIFLDEAGYCSLIKSVVLFTFNCPVTLLGDHMQLPPVCEINKETILDNLIYNPISLWEIPSIYIYDYFFKGYEGLFENYKNSLPPPQIKTEILSRTFRFGSELSTILGTFVYHHPMLSAASSSTLLYFINAEPQIQGKRGNPSEAQRIFSLLKDLSTDDFVILTPYREQVALIKQTMPNIDKERILTVHKSQGLEWDTVILSVSDSRISGKWFTSSRIKVSQGLQLINTAVSRAKKRLIIVCDYDYWITQNNELIAELLKISSSYHTNEATQ